MKKKLAISTIIFSLLFISISTGGTKSTPLNIAYKLDLFGNYTGFKNLPLNYTIEQALKDECLVFKNFRVVGGNQYWDEFVTKTEKGENADIRFAKFYDDKVYYSDLFYKSGNFRIFNSDSKDLRDHKFSKIFELKGSLQSVAIIGRVFIISNDDTLTYNDVMMAYFSSDSNYFKKFPPFKMLFEEPILFMYKPKPSVDFTIKDYNGAVEQVAELIFQDNDYQYYLTSQRSDKIMIEFKEGGTFSLKDALDKEKISVSDLILAGQQMIMKPVVNPLGGEFSVPQNHFKFSVRNNFHFYPSNIFMYIVYDKDFTTYFNLAELADIIDASGIITREEVIEKLEVNCFYISGLKYVKQSELNKIDFTVDIGWEMSAFTPVEFIND